MQLTAGKLTVPDFCNFCNKFVKTPFYTERSTSKKELNIPCVFLKDYL